MARRPQQTPKPKDKRRLPETIEVEDKPGRNLLTVAQQKGKVQQGTVFRDRSKYRRTDRKRERFD